MIEAILTVTDPQPAIEVALIAAGGAALAALIAGVFSYLGLIITKESEVSTFRQTWIDELRADIAILVANSYQIHAYVSMHRPMDDAAFWEATHDNYVELNRASIRIKLRLNPTECESKLILRSMEELEKLFGERGLIMESSSLNKLHGIVEALERDTPPLLKTEWERVKRGEPIYRRSKWVAAILSCLFAIAASYFFWKIPK